MRNKSERKRRVIGEREDCELGDREKLREKGKSVSGREGEEECELGERKKGGV